MIKVKVWLKPVNAVYRICLMLLAVMVVTACATNGFAGIGDPLTTSSYVDGASAESAARIAETEKEIKQISSEIEDMQSDMDTFRNIKTDLDEMPKEMLRQLVEALQSYLEMLEKEGK